MVNIYIKQRPKKSFKIAHGVPSLVGGIPVYQITTLMNVKLEKELKTGFDSMKVVLGVEGESDLATGHEGWLPFGGDMELTLEVNRVGSWTVKGWWLI